MKQPKKISMTMEMFYRTTNTASAVAIADIPVVEYEALYNDLKERMTESRYHVAHYFATEYESGLKFYMIILDDETGEVLITSFVPDYYTEGLASLTAVHQQFHPFEREIYELYGVPFNNHPWLKPLRFSHDRRNRESTMDSYPFYQMEGDELHEVNVGPIHAGIIEPGAFRFICNGEQVLHLEIALGYQHRGVEGEMVRDDNKLRQTLIAESIAGDTAVGHATAYAEIIEKLVGTNIGDDLKRERLVAIELERIAMHLADTGALATDIGFQLYGSIFEREGYSILNYNVGVFNGSGINAKDHNSSKDFIARVIVKPFKGFAVSGSYMCAETNYGLDRYMKSPRFALGAWYENGTWIGRAEYVHANFGETCTDSFYALAGYNFEKPWSVYARYEFIKDEGYIMDRDRIQLGTAYKPFKFLRLQANLNYEINDLAPEAYRNSLGFNLLVTAMF